MKKTFKQRNNPKFDECFIKVDVERLGYNNLLRDFKIMKSVVKSSISILTTLSENIES